MSTVERTQSAIERLHEDERIRGDLGDGAARALLEWATRQVTMVASDASRSDAEVAAGVQAIRTAARIAAREGQALADAVVAAAEHALRSAHANTHPSTNTRESKELA